MLTLPMTAMFIRTQSVWAAFPRRVWEQCDRANFVWYSEQWCADRMSIRHKYQHKCCWVSLGFENLWNDRNHISCSRL